MAKSSLISGECFCASVQYQIDGELFDARSCHCSRCRKAFSAAASAYALVNADEFSWLVGEDLLTTYTGKYGFGLQFCSRCGSTLTGVFQGEVHGVTMGCLNGEPDIKLNRHINVSSKASWHHIAKGVDQYQDNGPAFPHK